MNQEDNTTLQNKILEGLRKSFLKLVETKRKDNEELVFMKEGKIVRVKARDIDTSAL
jgi:hypothetical protein